MKNAARHPKRSVIQTTSGAATTAPMEAPALIRPLAKAFSFGGYHSLTALIEAMKFPDSPAPRRNRNTPKPIAERTNPCSALDIDHQIMKKASEARVPNRSQISPLPTYITVYAARKAWRMVAYWIGEIPSSLVKTGATTLRVCRST